MFGPTEVDISPQDTNKYKGEWKVNNHDGG